LGHRVQLSHAALTEFILQTLIVYRFFVLEKSYERWNCGAEVKTYAKDEVWGNRHMKFGNM
jgi:hypothetical protein